MCRAEGVSLALIAFVSAPSLPSPALNPLPHPMFPHTPSSWLRSSENASRAVRAVCLGRIGVERWKQGMLQNSGQWAANSFVWGGVLCAARAVHKASYCWKRLTLELSRRVRMIVLNPF